MRRTIPTWRGFVAVLLAAGLVACTTPYIAAPKPAEYVHVLPLPEHGGLADILLRNGRPVGEQDPTTPGDPSVRILHGQPFQAHQLFEAMARDGQPLASPLGRAVRLPDGAILIYYEHVVGDANQQSVAHVTIFVLSPGLPVSELRFYVPPGSMPSCFGGCDGGGDM